MIYTSYFANLKNIPATVVPISICGKAPAGYDGLQYKRLAPKYLFFSIWKQNHDNSYYIEHFQKEVLAMLDPKKVYSDLMNMSGWRDIVLVCYEKPTDFCHRHLVCEWLNKNNIKCKEF